MRKIFLAAVVTGFLLPGLLAVEAQAATAITWEALNETPAAQFDDPYAALSIQELRSLGTVLRLRKQLSGTGVVAGEREELQKQLNSEEAKLAAAGVRTDWLLEQREAIGLQRAKAALEGNPALDGKDIAITGYVIPVLNSDGVSMGGYLVPEFGMCSHVPAPDPNQMIHYKLPAEWQADQIYQAVLLKGRLELAVTRQAINLLDGQVEMISAYDMAVSEIHPLEEGGRSLKDRIFRFFKPGQ
ncbi:DUF3299 domain-containing protein [Roseibium polysiphoniae]|uniref:DUF3299 domain-containing protein n=1 Tax=Roseibium polysiphoniae TaxID=2571221 RepID=A0ABR9CC19_9HYPH|nr:DUF3299 domain-containing protein [Roseibium polysiphoniae]MBD8877441.1 DUF3299 domain-containing protein [Roseibium polysiphoniae]